MTRGARVGVLTLALLVLVLRSAAGQTPAPPTIRPVFAYAHAGPLTAQEVIHTTSPVGFAWTASPTPEVIGYNLYLDGAGYRDLGHVLQTPKEPMAVGPHRVWVTAYTATQESGPSNILTFLVDPLLPADDPACLPPLGNRSIALVVTRLTKTGSGGAGSRAALDLQLGSQSRIIHLAVLANGVELAGGQHCGANSIECADLTSTRGLWFYLPTASGTYPLTVRASNLYGCLRDVLTSFTVRVP